MVKRYLSKNIRILLTKGFNAEELRRFCFDTTDFRPVYDEFAPNMGKDEIIDLILDYADRTLKFETLLDWAKKHNLHRYKRHQPYYDPTRILLVDDNEYWRGQLGGLLQDLGYQVVAAMSREQAIQCVRENRQYSLAIIDMRLNEEDEEDREGVALGFWLRDNGYDFPIIIITAYDMEAEIAKNIALRPFQFVAVEKGKIGSGGVDDPLRQIELAIP
jgi:CheY-like chemotaxis protein